jgi:uncharacterized membrane protein YgcG
VRDSADNSRVRLRATLLAGLIFVLGAFFAPGAGAAPATFSGASGDGKAVFFTTVDKLVPGDTDTRTDVYVRSYDESLERHVTRQVSVGPIGGNDAHHATFLDVSASGGRAFFATEEKLVTGDQDLAEDIYVRNLGASTTQLVSEGSDNLAAIFVSDGLAANGQKVFFRTEEQLAAGDKDTSYDVYVRDLLAGTTLVSAGAAACGGEGCGNGDFDATFRGASVDGTIAFFISEEELVPGDDDGGLLDLYRRDLTAGVTVQVSLPDECPSGADCNVSYGGASPDGSRAYFETTERLSDQDKDDFQDVYDWTTGGIALVSTGPAGGNGEPAAVYKGASSDGARVFFETSESLVPTDEDGANDLYERVGGATNLVSTGLAGGNAEVSAAFLWVSPDGSSDAVFFTTAEQLTSADKDAFQDVYSREGGTTTLLSATATAGNGAFDASFADASDDGSHLFVVTEERLVPAADTDSVVDVYEFTAGTVTLVSTGPLASNSALPAGLLPGAVAEDGSHAFFVTEERLTEGDPDAEADVYDHFSGGTLLASTGNFAPLGPPTPSQLSTDPASPGTSLAPRIKGQSDPNTSIKIYTTPDCSGVPIATGSQVELGGAGIPVTVTASSSTSFRATATDTNGDTSPCSASVSYAHQPESPPPPPPPPPPPLTEESSTGGTTGGSTGGSGSGGGSRGGGGKGVVYVVPRTQITFAPASKTRARRPIFRFTDSTGQEGTSFKCKLDRERWRGCSSPVKLKKLKLGRHVFQVKAVNAVGVPEPAATKRAFKVVAR